jgi:RNA polymerase sigma-70 factor (ECF subfamily)
LEQVWEMEFKRHLLTTAMQSIEVEFPQTTWEAFRQYAMQARPVATVASELKISQASVYAAKSRILNRLRQILDGQVDLD